MQTAKYAKTHDMRLNCLNTHGFIERMDMLEKRLNMSEYAIIFMNVKNFRTINARVGFVKGNQVLYTIVDILNSILKGDEFFCCMGGDNFFVFLRKANLQKNIDILNNIKCTIEANDKDVIFTISFRMGIYEIENDMINAVSKGQLQLEKIILSMFSANMFEKRSNDTLRNAKNYCIILNTLLRKAAENGGVHPIHIDKISGEFALKIESMNDFEQVGPNMVEMFRTYCRLVRKHSVMKYSSAVRKAILVIESDISSEISVSELAKSQGLSLGYFSTLFKKETGKSVSDFIREKRMKRASHLLRTTDLQIQTVAEKCGILDLRYFSKLFKREYGVPPKQYREQNTVIQKNIEE
jgi:diguanylate cyclase (GGDEF)-like protein